MLPLKFTFMLPLLLFWLLCFEYVDWLKNMIFGKMTRFLLTPWKPDEEPPTMIGGVADIDVISPPPVTIIPLAPPEVVF